MKTAVDIKHYLHFLLKPEMPAGLKLSRVKKRLRRHVIVFPTLSATQMMCVQVCVCSFKLRVKKKIQDGSNSLLRLAQM